MSRHNKHRIKFVPARVSSDAPAEQLLITENNVTEIVNRIYVKKSGIVNPEVVNALRHLCKINDTHDPIRMQAIFLMRKEILENASEIYIEGNEDKLFNETIDELEVILEILKENKK